VAIFDLVNRQDWEVCELAQHGVTSRAFREGGIYVPSERHIRREMCDFVLERLSGQVHAE
jgi:Rieske 2Fe-2S family protein